jgi:hypothetical protein
MAFVDVHSLRKANVGSNGRGHEVEYPKGWQDSTIKLAALQSVRGYRYDFVYPRVNLLDSVDIDHFRSNLNVMMLFTKLGCTRRSGALLCRGSPNLR